MTDRELMQQALDALEKIGMGGDPRWADDVAPTLRARLAQPKPEPVAWYLPSDEGYDSMFRDHRTIVKCTGNPWTDWQPLYTAPQQREWQGLTDEEIREFELWLDAEEEKHGWNPPADIVKYIEAKLKDKNG